MHSSTAKSAVLALLLALVLSVYPAEASVLRNQERQLITVSDENTITGFATSGEICPLSPLPISPFSDVGCVHVRDTLASTLDDLAVDLQQALESQTFAQDMAEDLRSVVLSPVSLLVKEVLRQAKEGIDGSGLRDTNFCLGDFYSGESLSSYEGVCQHLPLSPNRWTVFGFALALGFDSPFQQFCPDTTDGYASFCMAIMKDCNSYPSIMLSFNPHLFKCQPFDSILAASTTGLSEIVVHIASEIATHSTFGVSFSKSVEQRFLIHTTESLEYVEMPGNIYTSASIDVGPSDFSAFIPDFWRIRGTATKLISVDGDIEPVESAIDWIKYHPLQPEKALRATEYYDDIEFRAYFGLHDLTFDILFSQLGTGLPLSDLTGLSVGQASLYASNVGATSSIPLSSGIYFYVHGDQGMVIYAVLEFLLKAFAKPLSALPNWIPYEFDPLQILSQIDLGNLDSLLAVYVDESKVRFTVHMLLPDLLLEYIDLTCEIRLDRTDVKCSPNTALGSGGVIQVLFEKGRAAWIRLVNWASTQGEKIYDEVESFGESFGDLFQGVSVEAAKEIGEKVHDEVLETVVGAGEEVISQAQALCDRIFGGC